MKTKTFSARITPARSSKFTAGRCAVLSLVLSLMGLAIYLITRQQIYSGVDENLRQRAAFFATIHSGVSPMIGMIGATAQLTRTTPRRDHLGIVPLCASFVPSIAKK